MIESLNYGSEIITCLPKKTWRPFSLLNTDFQIGSEVISNRFKSVLTDQTGFIVGENIRFVYDIMQYRENYEIPRRLLFIDFLKSFDSISWDSLLNIIKFCKL